MFGRAFTGEKKQGKERRRSSIKLESKGSDGSGDDNRAPPIVRGPRRLDSRATADTQNSLDLLDESHTRTTETAQLSLSNDRFIEESGAFSSARGDVFRTPVEGISEISAAPHMLKGLDFMDSEVDRSSSYGQVNSDSTAEGSPPSSAHVPCTPESTADTCVTDGTLAHSLDSEYGFLHSRAPSAAAAAPRRESSCLITFQRRIEKQMVETTLHARADGTDEDSMADLVRRLQRSAGVLTFGKKDLKRIGRGSRQIVFILPQVNRATFSKEEFGQMTTSEIIQLTPERPILVEVSLERTVSGEQLEIF